MNLKKLKREWEYYAKETEENDIVDIDLHFSMAMEVGGLIKEIERLNQEITDLKEVYQDRCEDIDFYVKMLQEIDTHIRSDKNPIPYIIDTLKNCLPEYMDMYR